MCTAVATNDNTESPALPILGALGASVVPVGPYCCRHFGPIFYGVDPCESTPCGSGLSMCIGQHLHLNVGASDSDGYVDPCPNTARADDLTYSWNVQGPVNCVYAYYECQRWYEALRTGLIRVTVDIADAGMCGGDDSDVSGVTVAVRVKCIVDDVKLPPEACPGAKISASAQFECGDVDPEDVDSVWALEDNEEGCEILDQSRSGSEFYASIRVGENPGNGSVKVVARHPDDPQNCRDSGTFKVLCSLKKNEDKPGDGGNVKSGCCGGGGGRAGDGKAEPGQLDFRMELGALGDGRSAGSLHVSSEHGHHGLGTRFMLDFGRRDDDIDVMYDALGVRQVKTPGLLVDIVDVAMNDPIEGDMYEIRLYAEGDFDPDLGGEDLYTIYAETNAFIIWQIADPDAPSDGLHQFLWLSKYVYDVGQSGHVLRASYLYEYENLDDPPGSATPPTHWTWKLVTHNGNEDKLRDETVEWSFDDQSGEWTRTYTAMNCDAGGTAPIKEVTETWEEDQDGIRLMVNREVNPGGGGSPLETDYTYYGETHDAAGRVGIITQPDGSWVAYTYSFAGNGLTATMNEIRPWLDALPPADLTEIPEPDATGVSSTVTAYVTNSAAPGFGRVNHRTEWANGANVGYTNYTYSESEQDVLEITESRRGTDNNYLTTITRVDLAHDERMLSIWHPDKTFDLYEYETEGSLTGGSTNPQFDDQTPGTFTRVLVSHGTSRNGPPEDVSYHSGKSTRQTVVRDGAGRVVLSEMYVYNASDWDRVSWTMHEYDDENWLETTYHSNGTQTQTQRIESPCCGTRTVTDAAGVVTKYSYDALGRLTERIDNLIDGAGTPPSGSNITTNYYYSYDSVKDVRVVRTVVDEGGALELETVQRQDLLGRPVSQTDAASLETTYAYGVTAGGGVQVTTTRPGGATEITSHYRDGRTMSVSGTAVVPSAYKFAVDSGDGTQSSSVLTGTDDPTATDWDRTTTTIYDELGRVSEEHQPAYPSGGGTVTTVYTYYLNGVPGAGRVEKMAPSGMAATLYTYGSFGNVYQTGLDIDGNDSLDRNGLDRMTQSEVLYVQDAGDWWHETRTTVYTTNNRSDAMVTTYQRERLTGFSGNTTAESETEVEYRSANTPGSPITRVTTVTTTTDPVTRTVVRTTDAPDSSTDAVATIINGLQRSMQTNTGHIYNYVYDDLGRRRQVVDPRTGVATTVYDVNTGRVESVTNAHGDETQYQYDSQTGRLSAVGNEYATDAFNYTRYAYTTSGQVEKIWGDVPQPVFMEYDGYGQRTHLTTFRGTDDFTATAWPTGVDHGDGDTTVWAYDLATGLPDSKTYADSTATAYDYTTEGRLETRTWARELVTTYSYDDDTGELKGVDYSDWVLPDLTFRYTRMGMLAEVADTRLHTTDHLFNYGDWPLAVTETVSSYGSTTRVITQTYDTAAGRLAGLAVDTDYNATYEYDAATGRLARVTGPGLPDGTQGSPGAHYAYLTGTDLVSHLLFKDDSGGSGDTLLQTVRQYETNRNLIDYIQNTWVPNGPVELSKYDYTNDILGLRTNVAYTGTAFQTTMSQSFGYNDRNELTSSTRGADDWDYGYDNIGNRETYTKDLSGSDPQAVTYVSNELNQNRVVNSEDVDLAFQFHFDADGNLDMELDLIPADMDCDGDVDFDDMDPFILAMSGEAAYLAQYPYCRWLNGDLNGDGNVNFGDIDYFVGEIGSEAASVIYTWNAENRLASIEPADPVQDDQKVEFAYDYRGRRVWKLATPWNSSLGGGAGDWDNASADLRKYVWSGWKLLMEFGGVDGNTISRKYTWGLDLSGQGGQINSLEGAGTIGGLLATYDTAETAGTSDDRTFVYCYDTNGNVGQLVETTAGANYGTFAVRYEYGPYGSRINAPTQGEYEQPFRFSTKQWDDETGLGYWGYRYYNPTLGRWMSRDPIGERGGVNLYGYVNNAPTARWDPLGLSPPTSQPTSQPACEDHSGWLDQPFGYGGIDGTRECHPGTERTIALARFTGKRRFIAAVFKQVAQSHEVSLSTVEDALIYQCYCKCRGLDGGTVTIQTQTCKRKERGFFDCTKGDSLWVSTDDAETRHVKCSLVGVFESGSRKEYVYYSYEKVSGDPYSDSPVGSLGKIPGNMLDQYKWKQQLQKDKATCKARCQTACPH